MYTIEKQAHESSLWSVKDGLLVFADCLREADAQRIVDALNALVPGGEVERLREACRACEEWHRAESEGLGTFHDRMDLCSYSEWATKRALGLPCDDEWKGVPRLVLKFNEMAALKDEIAALEAKC